MPGTALSCGAEAAVFALLGFVAMIAIILAVVSVSVPARSGSQLLSAAERSSLARYFGSGRLIADARTLASMAHYLMEPERIAISNANDLFPKQSITIPTNHDYATAAAQLCPP